MNFNAHRAPIFILLHVFVIYNCCVLRLARETKVNISQLSIPSDGLFGNNYMVYARKLNKLFNQIETLNLSTLIIDLILIK